MRCVLRFYEQDELVETVSEERERERERERETVQ
jgi:hypothetical protein